MKALTQAHGRLVKLRQNQLKKDAQDAAKSARQAASKAVSATKVMLEAKKLEEDAKAVDELRQQSASDIHDLIARFGHPLVPFVEAGADTPELSIDFNKPFLKRGQKAIAQIEDNAGLKLAYDAFTQSFIRSPQYKKKGDGRGFFTLGSESDHGVDESFLQALNLGKDVITQSPGKDVMTAPEEALVRENIMCSFVGQACAAAAGKGKENIEHHTYGGFEQMQMGSIRLQLQGQRKMALCHFCDLCAFLVSKKQDEGYEKYCAGEAPKLKEVMNFWREITANHLDEMGRSQCEIFRTDIEPGDLILIPAGMLIHERVFGSQINYSLKMGLLYTNKQHY